MLCYGIFLVIIHGKFTYEKIHMTIQDITVSNNIRKKIITVIRDKSVIIIEENGDVIVSVAAYNEFAERINRSPLEEVLGNDVLDFSAEYFVFS